MLLNKETIYLDINKNISIFRIREEYYNDIMCSINKNEILFNRICTDAYQVFINVFSKNLEKNYKLTEPSFYKDHILILNSISSFLHDYYVSNLLNKGLTIRECAMKLNITIVTAFFWRHRFLFDFKNHSPFSSSITMRLPILIISST